MSDILNYKKHLKILEKEERLEVEQLRNDIKETFGTTEGKRVLYHILAMCEIYSDCFTGNAQTYYLEGRRSIGLELLDLIMETDSEIYIDIIKEKSNE